uniref:Uncharacterized protein n=1 Tax=Plectus sambesii TaxID=2011161 RepID=A0A914W452_9BILA
MAQRSVVTAAALKGRKRLKRPRPSTIFEPLTTSARQPDYIAGSDEKSAGLDTDQTPKKHAPPTEGRLPRNDSLGVAALGLQSVSSPRFSLMNAVDRINEASKEEPGR